MEDLVVVYDGADSTFRQIAALALEPDGKVIGPEDAQLIDADLYLVDERSISWTEFVRTLGQVRQLGIPVVIISAHLDDWVTDLVMQRKVVGFLEPIGSPIILRHCLVDTLNRLER